MKKTVFISSTYSDLFEERRAMWNLLEEFEVTVRGMEKFGARTEAPLDTCLAEVDLSDIYIGIISMRLGSIDKNKGKSYTQLEYERAVEFNKEILIYIIDEDNAKISPKNVDYGSKREQLDTFKDLLKERHTIAYFSSPDDLVEKLRRDFDRYLQSKVRPIKNLEDKLIESKEIIEKFLLIPKHYSGREVLLSLEYKSSPYPASREICQAFNLEFGSTVGVDVSIVLPDGLSSSGLKELYISAKQLDNLMPIVKGGIREIYARLQFFGKEVSTTRANYSREVFYTSSIPTASVFNADGKIGLLFSKLLQEPKKST